MSAQRPVYLDNQATTPLDPRVFEAMLPYLKEEFGNPSSRHHVYGQKAHEAVERARTQVAKLLGTAPDEVIFTSGATEANNLALRGVMLANRSRGNHLITVVTEHKAVLDAAAHLQNEGFEVTLLPVGDDGLLDVVLLKQELRPQTVLVSVMAVNNEIGVVQPLEAIGTLCREAGVLYHCDAAQAAGKMELDVNQQKIDLLSLSAHKLYGPKGIGALYVRRKRPRVRVQPLVRGGGHERGLRSGTLDAPSIVGFGEACRLAGQEMEKESMRLRSLRDRLLQMLHGRLPEVTVNGCLQNRMPGNLNVRIAGVDSEGLLYSLRRIAISSGSACTSHRVEPSHVLRALGLEEHEALECIRFGLGRFNRVEDLELAVEEVAQAAERIRSLSGYIPRQTVGV